MLSLTPVECLTLRHSTTLLQEPETADITAERTTVMIEGLHKYSQNQLVFKILSLQLKKGKPWFT